MRSGNVVVLGRVLAVVALLGLPAAAACGQVRPAPSLHGAFGQYEGLPVLVLWGTPEEAGYAHGYLLAERMTALLDDYVLTDKVIPNVAMYETVLLPAVRRQFVWNAGHEQELRAMWRGVRDKLGEKGLQSERLGRSLTVEDLMVANALADWYSMLACSSFSAWGKLTADGQTITARNLDFGFTGEMERAQLVVVYRGDGKTRPWIGVTWPGTIGVYTAMNGEGVTMLMHDARGLPAARGDGFTPRSLILREALEAAGGKTFAEDVQRVLCRRSVMVGNNIHVSGPRRSEHPPAVVFEYDANLRDQGVSLRTPKHNTAVLAEALCCTNHMRQRQKPVQTKSGRYDHLAQRLAQIAANGEQLDAAGAMKLIHEVRWNVPTLHSVVLEPSRRTMHVHIPAVSEQVVEFCLDDWLKAPPGQFPASDRDASKKDKP